MTDEFEIDGADALDCASAVTDTGGRVVAGRMRTPDPVPGPRWATTDRVARVADLAGQRLTATGDDISAAARQIIAAVTDYEAADERAAARLRGAPDRRNGGPLVPEETR